MTILTHNSVAKRAEMDNYIFSLFSEYHDDSSLQDAGKKERTAVKKTKLKKTKAISEWK